MNKGASSAVDHEDEGRRPGEHFSLVVHGADGVAGAGISGVAKVGIGIVEVLCDGFSVRRVTEEGFKVIIARWFVESLGDLLC